MHGMKHTKSRAHNTHKPPDDDLENCEHDDDINLVISANMHDVGIELSIDQAAASLGHHTQQHLVVTTDTNGTPITYEAGDIAALIQLMPSHDDVVDTDECRTILMSHSTEITSSVFTQD